MINVATIRRIRQLAKKRSYSYRHIQAILEVEGLGKPAISFIYKIKKEIKKK